MVERVCARPDCDRLFRPLRTGHRYCSPYCQGRCRKRPEYGQGCCPECQATFVRRHREQEWCGATCANRARLRVRYPGEEGIVDGRAVPAVKECEACGRRFGKPRDTSWRKWADRRYCCARCGQGAPRVKPPAPVVSLRADMWRELAACRDADPGLFAPPDAPGQVDWPMVTRVAQRWCADCPAREACLDDALAARAWGCGLRGGVLRYYKGGAVHQVDVLALADEPAGVAS